MTRDEILQQNSLVAYLARIGVKTRGDGVHRTANRCAGTQHGKDHWCVSIDAKREIWHCNDCGTGGSIIDWLAIEQNRPATSVFADFARKYSNDDPPPMESSTPKVVATYDYTDENGTLIYQSVRYEPKSFSQRRPDSKGGWIKNMDGVTRVLYRLPDILKAETVIHCEGEKDADNLRKIGFTASTSVAGANGWLDAYADTYKGKHVVVIPDNDPPGWKYAKAVIESLHGKAASAKLMPMPEPHKDASDYIATFAEPKDARAAIQSLIDKTPHAIKPIPLLNLRELEERYTAMVRRIDAVSFNLGKFLPSLGRVVRRLIPGQLIVVLASTGVGKTAILQTMARCASPLPSLFFELELPAEDMFERFVQMEIGCSSEEIEAEYKTLSKPIWEHYKGLTHIVVCPQSGISPADIEGLIEQSQLKFGERPKMVFVDYVGLVQCPGVRSRYEAISNAAEQLKVIAKRTETIVVMASQVHRPGDKTKSIEVSLTDGKDSGSIENSAGLVLGAWRPDNDTLVMRVLKNTHGRTGQTVECNFDGKLMRITERSDCRFTTQKV